MERSSRRDFLIILFAITMLHPIANLFSSNGEVVTGCNRCGSVRFVIKNLRIVSQRLLAKMSGKKRSLPLLTLPTSRDIDNLLSFAIMLLRRDTKASLSKSLF